MNCLGRYSLIIACGKPSLRGHGLNAGLPIGAGKSLRGNFPSANLRSEWRHLAVVCLSPGAETVRHGKRLEGIKRSRFRENRTGGRFPKVKECSPAIAKETPSGSL